MGGGATVEPEEFRKACRSLYGVEAHDEEIDAIFELLDVDGDGALDLAELTRQAKLLGSLDHTNVPPTRANFFSKGKTAAYLEAPYYKSGPLGRYGGTRG